MTHVGCLVKTKIWHLWNTSSTCSCINGSRTKSHMLSFFCSDQLLLRSVLVARQASAVTALSIINTKFLLLFLVTNSEHSRCWSCHFFSFILSFLIILRYFQHFATWHFADLRAVQNRCWWKQPRLKTCFSLGPRWYTSGKLIYMVHLVTGCSEARGNGSI